VTESCLTLGSAVDEADDGDLETCENPRGATQKDIRNFVGEYECNVEIKDKEHFYPGGTTCNLSCPQGFKVNRKDDRTNCQCNKNGCRWHQLRPELERNISILVKFSIF